MNWDKYYEERDRETVERIRRAKLRDTIETAVFAPLAVATAGAFAFALILLGF